MQYRKYNPKKKSNPNSLINFDDFVRYRTDKERIINVRLFAIVEPLLRKLEKGNSLSVAA